MILCQPKSQTRNVRLKEANLFFLTKKICNDADFSSAFQYFSLLTSTRQRALIILLIHSNGIANFFSKVKACHIRSLYCWNVFSCSFDIRILKSSELLSFRIKKNEILRITVYLTLNHVRCELKATVTQTQLRQSSSISNRKQIATYIETQCLCTFSNLLSMSQDIDESYLHYLCVCQIRHPWSFMHVPIDSLYLLVFLSICP